MPCSIRSNHFAIVGTPTNMEALLPQRDVSAVIHSIKE